MAKKKQATAVAEVRELEKTLVIDGTTYNINAVQADKVAKKLTVKKIKKRGKISLSFSLIWLSY